MRICAILICCGLLSGFLTSLPANADQIQNASKIVEKAANDAGVREVSLDNVKTKLAQIVTRMVSFAKETYNRHGNLIIAAVVIFLALGVVSFILGIVRKVLVIGIVVAVATVIVKYLVNIN